MERAGSEKPRLRVSEELRILKSEETRTPKLEEPDDSFSLDETTEKLARWKFRTRDGFRVVDRGIIRRLAQIGCTLQEIAEVFDTTPATIKSKFGKEINVGVAHRKMSLRHQQHLLAMAGDRQMLIWLGKQELGQKERSELTGPDNGPIQINLIDRFVDDV